MTIDKRDSLKAVLALAGALISLGGAATVVLVHSEEIKTLRQRDDQVFAEVRLFEKEYAADRELCNKRLTQVEDALTFQKDRILQNQQTIIQILNRERKGNP